VTCELGHQHWGLFGAAGLLAFVHHPTDPAMSLVLLQHRAQWSHQGGTWALPGGAMDSDETSAEAALREADEECMLDPKLVVPRGLYTDEHGGWAYHTVLAQAAEPLRVRADGYESEEAVWLPAEEVDRLDLHPGFAASWPVLRAALAPLTVFVDGTGSRDPGDAGRRLHAHLSGLTRYGLAALPDSVPGPLLARWYPDYVLVLEGAAAAAVANAAAADAARAASEAPRFAWNEPLTVRRAEIRIVAVTGGAQAGDIIADLAASTPGRRLAVSDRRAVRDRVAAAGTGTGDLNWLRPPRTGPGQAAAPPLSADHTVVPRAEPSGGTGHER
jgi:ADP-ribose pyrophosphatase YjhB (NUDIX family)